MAAIMRAVRKSGWGGTLKQLPDALKYGVHDQIRKAVVRQKLASVQRSCSGTEQGISTLFKYKSLFFEREIQGGKLW